MPVMFCYIDPFTMEQAVTKLTPGDAENIFHGSIDEVTTFMAEEYNHEKYDRIVLNGPLAETIADQIRTYSLTKYNNREIEIEVLK